MPTLAMLIDFDNVDSSLRQAGPVSLAKALVQLIPPLVLQRHDTVRARMYGGWRARGSLTNAAQRLVPDIRAGSPTVVSASNIPEGKQLSLVVELAEGPLGSRICLDDTFVRDRTLRRFRARNSEWPDCAQPGPSCGLIQYASTSSTTACAIPDCSCSLGKVLVRDEQKMVDTMLVADMAHEALVQRATDVVIVSSDSDIWPGVLLATQNGCNVVHLHSTPGWRTSQTLVRTLDTDCAQRYQQAST